jgi:hypothetical protein
MPRIRPIHAFPPPVLAFLLAAAAAPLAVEAQRRVVAAPAASAAADLAALGDEFDDAGSLASWRRFETVEGWPDHARRVDVNTTSPGHLYLEPATSGWYADWHGPFLFREVAGDFDVTARLRVDGLAGGLPTSDWSLAGLMVREPRPGRAAWAPERENWLFATTGVADDLSQPLVETKSTVNGRSNLKLRRGCAGWVELRAVRVREAFVLLSRCEGAEWRVRDRFLRRDLPPSLQVGLVAYSDWSTIQRRFGRDAAAFVRAGVRDGRPDLALRVDWVRFRPAPAVDGPADVLTDYALSDAELLRRLGPGPGDGAAAAP